MNYGRKMILIAYERHFQQEKGDNFIFQIWRIFDPKNAQKRNFPKIVSTDFSDFWIYDTHRCKEHCV